MTEPLPIGEAIGWVGTPLADLEAEAIGEVQSVYIDSTSHQPSWFVAKLAGSGRRARARGSSPCRSTSARARRGSGSGRRSKASACAAPRSSIRPARCCASTS